MWSRVKNLKLYKQAKPIGNTWSDKDNQDFLGMVKNSPVIPSSTVLFALPVVSSEQVPEPFTLDDFLHFLGARNPKSA